jgi:hypothetical protein
MENLVNNWTGNSEYPKELKEDDISILNLYDLCYPEINGYIASL